MMHALVIGPHPDDCESQAGGSAALWRKRGDAVRFLSITDGRLGHYDHAYLEEPKRLIDRRLSESEAAAEVIGASVRNVGIPEGQVMVTPRLTETLVREIRRFGASPGRGPDLIVLNRPFDHHGDSRFAAQAVIAAVGLLSMPLLCPDAPALDRMPVVAYWHDDYIEESLFRPDVVVAIDTVIEQKALMMAKHESQMFEWLPYARGMKDEIPNDPERRLAWLRATWVEPIATHVRRSCAESFDAKLPHGRFNEAFQISEYGKQPLLPEIAALFPMAAV